MNLDTPEGLARAVAKQQALIDQISPGGRWFVPHSDSMYMLDQENKRVKRVHGVIPEPDITRVFEAMGWTVVEPASILERSEPIFTTRRTPLPLRLEHQGIPIASVEDWFRHAPPRGGSLQWRDGQSAKELAKAWCPEGSTPAPPRDFLDLLTSIPVLAALSFDVGYPEHRVRFDEALGERRNTDLAVVCTGLVGRVALSVEGKVDETFGRAVGEEIMGAAAQWAFEERNGELDRLRQLAHLILPPRRAGQARIGEIRYQLLTAIAGAWAFAALSQASIAVLVVHEFLTANVIPARIEENGRDLDRIVERVTNGEVRNVTLGQLVGPLSVPQFPSLAGVAEWYVGKCRTHLLPGGA